MDMTKPGIRINFWAFLIAAICIASTPVFAQGPPEKGELLDQAWKDVRKLASKEFAGRGYQDNGHTQAAHYIASRMQEMGLKPIPGNLSELSPYFDEFTFPLYLYDDIHLNAKKQNWEIGEDFIVSTMTGGGNLVNKKACYVGYGLEDEYSKLKGKIAVIESGLPEEIASDKEKKKEYREKGSDQVKLAKAVKSGAAGVIFLRDKLTAGMGRSSGPVPVMDVMRSSFPENKKAVKKVTMEVEAEKEIISSQNVIGFVEGKTYPDSVILVTGHYDHLGRQGTAIFTGANDNASGIAVILALASHFAKPENQPDHSIAFIAFGAEECGLIGSASYVMEDPVWPLAKTKFILNLDLMGNGDEGITAVAGREFPQKLEVLREINDEIKATPVVKDRSNAPNSDHYYFVEKGVPGFFIYTMGGPPHYHDVHDIADNLKFSRFYELHDLLTRFIHAVDQGM